MRDLREEVQNLFAWVILEDTIVELLVQFMVFLLQQGLQPMAVCRGLVDSELSLPQVKMIELTSEILV